MQRSVTCALVRVPLVHSLRKEYVQSSNGKNKREHRMIEDSENSKGDPKSKRRVRNENNIGEIIHEIHRIKCIMKNPLQLIF